LLLGTTTARGAAHIIGSGWRIPSSLSDGISYYKIARHYLKEAGGAVIVRFSHLHRAPM
jgi:hypothetical protein